MTADMPKKTRKEKLSAELRRLKQKVEIGDKSSQQASQPTAQPTISISNLKLATESPKQVAVTESNRYNYEYVVRDLKKIALVAALIIAFELAVNLTLRSNFAKLLLRTIGIEI